MSEVASERDQDEPQGPGIDQGKPTERGKPSTLRKKYPTVRLANASIIMAVNTASLI